MKRNGPNSSFNDSKVDAQNARPQDEHSQTSPISESNVSSERAIQRHATPENVAHDLSDSTTDFDEDERDPVECLASEFLDRRRAGESVTIREYIERYPDLAEQISEFFPAILTMEAFRDEPTSDTGVPARIKPDDVPERLGDLRIIRQIGRGGMGVVYEAEQESLHRRVAVKILPNLGVGDERRRQRFQREASAAAKLHHTNIVPVLGVGEHNGLSYYVMQLIRGVGLDEIIDRYAATSERHSEASESKSRTNNRETREASRESSIRLDSNDPTRPILYDDSMKETNLSFERLGLTDRVLEALQNEEQAITKSTESGRIATTVVEKQVDEPVSGRQSAHSRAAARIGLQAAEALAYAHEMLVLHRDIKPGNLIVDEHGIVWITDFGLAKIADAEDFSRSGDLVGTLRYMAPERFEGENDHRSDIHSLGSTLYELVTGRPAFHGDDRAQLIHRITQGDVVAPRRLRKGISRDLDTIILKAMAQDPSQRYQTATDFADDLRRYLHDLPIEARRASVLERGWKWCRRNPAIASLMSACVVLLLSVLGLSVGAYFQSQSLLAKEQSQRKRAEATNDLAVETLDAIYEQFAPRRGDPISTESLLGEDGEVIQVTAQPVLSDDSARMLESLLPLYGKLAELDGRSDRRFVEKSMQANRRIGDIRRQLGQGDLALESYIAADRLLQQLLEEPNPSAVLQLERASLKNDIGNTMRALDGRSEWRDSHREVVEILDRIAQSSIDDNPKVAEQASFERTRAMYQLGRVGHSVAAPQVSVVREFGNRRYGGSRAGDGPNREDGQWPGERQRGEFQEFIRGRGGIADWSGSRGREFGGRGSRGGRPPSGFDRRSPGSLGRGGRMSGLMIDSFGDKDLLNQAIDEATILVDRAPQNSEYVYLLATCYRERALMQVSRSDALSDLAEATTRLRELVESFPEISDYRFELARTLAIDLGRDEESPMSTYEESLQESVELVRKLTRQHPNIMSYSEFLGLLYLKQSEGGIRKGQHEIVNDTLWSAVEIYLDLYETAPDTLIHRVGLFNASTLWLTLTEARLKNAIKQAEENSSEQGDSAERTEAEQERSQGGPQRGGQGGPPPNSQREGEPRPRPDRSPRTTVSGLNEVSRMQQILDVLENPDHEPDRFLDGILFALYPCMASAYELAGDTEKSEQFANLSREFREQRRTEFYNSRFRRGDRTESRDGEHDGGNGNDPRRGPPRDPGRRPPLDETTNGQSDP